MNNFQTILVAVFLSFFVFAVLIFSGVIKIGGLSNNSNQPQGKLVLWGTLSNQLLSNTVDSVNNANKDLNFKYVQKNPETYQQDLVESFANGNGPDLFMITPDMIQRNNNFIYKIPYASYPEKVFRDSFIDGADVYLAESGVIGFPVFVDPMVLYYNKDILSNEGIAYPPKSWDELFNLNSFLTKKENNGTINQSMIALGQYENINNAKDVLATLLFQNNNFIVKENKSNYITVLNNNTSNYIISPAEAVLKFFLEFSNPSNTAYSWNRSLLNSLDMFTGGKLVFYLGRASELFKIESINPNLSFDVTQIPQVKDSKIKRTYGEIYAIVINKKSTNLTSAINIAGALSSGDNAKNLSVSLSLPPVSRMLLANKPEDPYLYTFFDSALISRSWPDPDKVKSNLIFKELVENILSNRLSVAESITKAQGQLELLNIKNNL
jgi:ABC-type glycerol-3-phosphate transport system substrate-binding protein